MSDADFNRRAMELLVPQAGGPDPLPGLPGTRAIHAVGGMLIGWSHAVPRPQLPAEWDGSLSSEVLGARLTEAESLLWADDGLYGEGSARQQWLRATVERTLGVSPRRVPLAARRDALGRIRFAGADALLDGAEGTGGVTILTGYVVTSIEHRDGRGVAVSAVNASGNRVRVAAGTIVVGAGAVGTPQLLHASGLRHPALGRYATEHLNVVSTVLLDDELPAAAAADAPVNIYVPVAEDRPFHTAIIDLPSVAHTGLALGDDSSRVTNIGSFIGTEPHESNGLVFDAERVDAFGMPAVSAQIELTPGDHGRAAQALAYQYTLASTIGRPWDGMAPFLRPIGSSLHLMGTTRIGVDPDTSVAEPNGRVRGTENIYVVGNNVLGSRNSCNPTLTTVALALHAADQAA